MKWPLTWRDSGAEKVVKTKMRVRSVFWFQVPRLGTRIYVQRHTPQKGIRPILDTVSRMKGRATEFDTSQLSEVTNAMSHVTALSSHNHYETRRAPTTTIDDWPRGPTTRIDERPRGPRAATTINERRIAPSMIPQPPIFQHQQPLLNDENEGILHGGNAEKTSDDDGECF